jgi:hypothetical protein
MDKIIYLFYKPGERLPFYCGIGGMARPKEHFEESNLIKNTLFYNTLRKMLLANLIPRIKIVETGLTWLEACDLEKQFILFYGRLDKGTGCLTNHTDGGEGNLGGRGWEGERSLDFRIKMAKAQLSRRNSPQQMRKAHAHQMTPVENYDIKTGVIVHKFESIRSVQDKGFTRSGVYDVLVGRQKTHSGYGWRYSK